MATLVNAGAAVPPVAASPVVVPPVAASPVAASPVAASPVAASPAQAGTVQGSSKGLRAGALGLVSSVVIAVSSTAPA